MSLPGAPLPLALDGRGQWLYVGFSALPIDPAGSVTVTDTTSTWETPEFVEIKMDAEINSYQDDFGDDYH